MKVICKNSNCKHYYTLQRGEHCIAEEYCKHYTSNKKKADRKRVMCRKCKHCKRILTNQAKEYHYECTYRGRNKVLLMIDERVCDCKI